MHKIIFSDNSNIKLIRAAFKRATEILLYFLVYLGLKLKENTPENAIILEYSFHRNFLN